MHPAIAHLRASSRAMHRRAWFIGARITVLDFVGRHRRLLATVTAMLVAFIAVHWGV